MKNEIIQQFRQRYIVLTLIFCSEVVCYPRDVFLKNLQIIITQATRIVFSSSSQPPPFSCHFPFHLSQGIPKLYLEQQERQPWCQQRWFGVLQVQHGIIPAGTSLDLWVTTAFAGKINAVRASCWKMCAEHFPPQGLLGTVGPVQPRQVNILLGLRCLTSTAIFLPQGMFQEGN